MRTVVVTGASSGIGWATCGLLAAKGVRVFGSVRKAADGERLKAELGEAFTALVFDVRDDAAVRAAAASVRERLKGEKLFGLVNNAGIAIAGPLLHLPMDWLRQQLDVNVIGQVSAIQAFAPLLGSDRTLAGPPGRIVNMSSVAGRVGQPFLGAYSASKHAFEGLSESLRRELMLYGIDVIIVGPGFVATPIWDKAEEADFSAFRGSEFTPAMLKVRDYMLSEGRKGYPPERVAGVVWRALTARRPKTRYAVVPNRFLHWTLPGMLPRRLVDWLIAKRLGLRNPAAEK